MRFHSVTTNREQFPMKTGDLLRFKGNGRDISSQFYRVGVEYPKQFQDQRDVIHPLTLERSKFPARGYSHPTEKLPRTNGWTPPLIVIEKGDYEIPEFIEEKKVKRVFKSTKPREYGQRLY